MLLEAAARGWLAYVISMVCLGASDSPPQYYYLSNPPAAALRRTSLLTLEREDEYSTAQSILSLSTERAEDVVRTLSRESYGVM